MGWTCGLHRKVRGRLALRRPSSPGPDPQGHRRSLRDPPALAVAAIVGENDGTDDEVIAALLQDAPEDAGARRSSPRSGPASGTGSRTSSPAARTRTKTRSHPGARARKITSTTSPRPPPPCAASPRLRGGQEAPQRPLRAVGLPCCRTTGPSEKTSGAASTAAGAASSGTTGRPRSRWRGGRPGRRRAGTHRHGAGARRGRSPVGRVESR